MADNLATLYEKYNILSDAKEKITEHSKEFLESIEGVKGLENEKMLTAQIISKFFKHFPQHQDAALNALLDLCEDDESKIRACAMRYLVTICKDVRSHTSKVTDILAQMMQLEAKDGQTAQWCLLQLWKEDPPAVLKALYSHIHSLPPSGGRERCVEFVHRKLAKLDAAGELEALVVDESRRLLQEDVSSEELGLVITFLKTTRYGRTAGGRQELASFVADVMEVDGEFEPAADSVEKVIACTGHLVSLFGPQLDSNRFVAYYCDQVLPRLDEIAEGEGVRLRLVQNLAELSAHAGKFENASLHVVQVFDKIKLYMPPPPEDADVANLPNFEFSFVESLLYAFHRLARQCPDFLTHDAAVLRDFRARLTYFSRGVQGCNKVVLGGSNKQEERTKIAPVILNNLNLLIKDLFYQPPMYKCNVTLSFKLAKAPVEAEKRAKTDSSPQKRHAPITFEGVAPVSKQNRGGRSGGDNVKLYQPPSGKFSNNFGGFERGGARNGRGRGRWARGRGAGRGWRN